MSRFSGKCDFYDSIRIFGLDYILNCDVYVGRSCEPLTLRCEADCIPYYPHLVSISLTGKDTGRGYIRLTKRSWVDIEEERYGHISAHDHYRRVLQEELDKHSIKR